MATRGSPVHNSKVEFRGHPKNVSVIQFSQKIDGFRQKDSQGFYNSYNSIYTKLYTLSLYIHVHDVHLKVFTSQTVSVTVD